MCTLTEENEDDSLKCMDLGEFLGAVAVALLLVNSAVLAVVAKRHDVHGRSFRLLQRRRRHRPRPAPKMLRANGQDRA